MTGQDIINVAWSWINDRMIDDSKKRYPIAVMVPLLNDGLQDLYARRPYHFLEADGSLGTFTELTTTTVSTTVLNIDESMRVPMANYLCFRTYSEDSGEDNDLAVLAKEHYSLYINRT